jgi:hypothetical protein
VVTTSASKQAWVNSWPAKATKQRGSMTSGNFGLPTPVGTTGAQAAQVNENTCPFFCHLFSNSISNQAIGKTLRDLQKFGKKKTKTKNKQSNSHHAKPTLFIHNLLIYSYHKR